MPNPKLEFFRFKLNHKTDDYKTFRQFMIENGKATSRQKDSTIFGNLFKYIMEKPDKDFETNNSLKKVITLIGDKKINKHLDKRPKVKFPACIISGVMNGGPFGKERILTNLDNKKELGNISSSQPVLQYYYIFLYLPLEHNEGFLMVHSDSAEETITQAYRKCIAELFKLGDYKKPTMQVFVPKHFRDEYKDGAVLQSLTFINNEVSDDLDDNNPLKEFIEEYEVRITLTPKGEVKANLGMLQRLRDYLTQKRFGTRDVNKGLDEFGKCTVNTKNEDTNTSKTFEWNNRDEEMMPVVYLKERVAIGDDGTPEFEDLDRFCHTLFTSHIIHEIRPDLDVQRVD